MALSARDRRALILGGVAVGLIGLYLLVVEPTLGWYDRLVTHHELLAGKIARTVRDQRKAAYLSGQITDWEFKAGELGPPKPYSEQITAVSEKIMTAAQKSRTDVQNSNWEAAAPWPDDPALQLARVHLEAQANWENVFQFIARLYRIPGVLSVEQMDLSGGDKKKKGRIGMRLTLSVLVEAAAQEGNAWAF